MAIDTDLERSPETSQHAAVEARRTAARAWFEGLRDRICAEIEVLEREAPAELFPGEPATFTYKPWQRKTGSGGGVGGFLSNGRLFEKIGIHTSSANGKLTQEMARNLPGDGVSLDYVSTSISLIMHPRSPRVPTVHMNTRFLSTSQGWFGGGADLTPMLPEQRSQDAEDAVIFHNAMKRACDAHDPAYYDKFKPWADTYFFLPHRGVARGVGGIFFDHLDSGDFDRDFAFAREVGSALLDVYPKIVRKRMVEPWTDEERAQQLACRGLYVEFNLLYDRGTMFGLQTGGNTETIMSSMPPLVSWS
ncbi:oxygen-dependent coproporphyrinogen oxidase [Rhodopseudomonas sp. BR0M22]|uniref:oxygen-dependent coproporphyrinogen oxidase n=1 Tax=Rhodopseudomonas sp. BR0M22 TaxID=2269369 RepID=UPI0013E0076A|nr:oxygen-dependent coproporphyrinogen oxidase [Rhodopseudomonas sp. BR0M22]MCD0423164.1 oxygen-dependent coproporphyrinogen oxidase [Rubrivivax sp. JA1024]NEW93238.1 oxygen-dependent coproporphyrinogen oxidase [Rhodopseudomonas sp. BR0M22]